MMNVKKIIVVLKHATLMQKLHLENQMEYFLNGIFIKSNKFKDYNLLFGSQKISF